METLFLIGQILFGGFFVVMGLMHFMKMKMMLNMAQSNNVPMAKLAVPVTGLMLILGGLSVFFNAYLYIGGWLLIIFLLSAAMKVHHFWNIQDPNMKMVQMQFFMRNMAFTGAVLMIMFA